MVKEQDLYWELIIQVICGEATPDEEQQLQEWLEVAPENRHLFEKAKRLLSATRKSPVVPVFDEQQGWTSFLQYLRKRSMRRWMVSLSGVAAVLVLVFFIFRTDRPEQAETIQPGRAKAILIVGNQPPIPVDNRPLSFSDAGNEIRNDSISGLVVHRQNEEAEEIIYSSLVIPKGGEYRITLPDGTQVWLNAESELRFPSRFTGDSRRIEFSGEGYFKVSKDSLHPFRIVTQEAELKVYGTEFNLYAYEEEKEVAATLVRGSISVTPEGGEEVKITPSQRLSYSKETKEISVREVDTQLYTSWKDGLYTFENATLEGIFNYLRRWYAFEVEYTDERLKEMRFTGEFQKDKPISYGLNLIRLTCEVNFTIDENKIIVMP